MKLHLDPSGPPAYAQIVDQLGEGIASGRLEPGMKLPTERELAAELGVSRMTVRQALNALTARGFLVRATGRRGGTFVARPKLVRDLGTFMGLSEQLRRQGIRAGARVLSAQRRPATVAVAAALELAPRDRVTEIVRLRLADDEPFALERSIFPVRRFPDLLAHDLEGSLYDVLDEAYGAAPWRAVERLEPVLASEFDAESLAVAPGSPLMLVERIAYADDGEPVEFARDLFRGDRTRVVAWTSQLSRD
jgi:GntR family transcriptional regulator